MAKNEGYTVRMVNEQKTMQAILYDLKQDIIKDDNEITKENHDTVKVMLNESNAAVSKNTMDDNQLSQNKSEDGNFKENQANTTIQLG